MPLYGQSSGSPRRFMQVNCFLASMGGSEIGQTIGNGYRDNRLSRIYDWFREMGWAKVATRAACVMGIPGGFCGIRHRGPRRYSDPTVCRPPTSLDSPP
jgi:hypothetical protein